MSEESSQIHIDPQRSSDRRLPTAEELRRPISLTELARVFDEYEPIDITIYKEGTVGYKYIDKEFSELNGRLRPVGVMEIPLSQVKTVMADRRTGRVLGDTSIEKLLEFDLHNLHEISLMDVQEFDDNVKNNGKLIKAKGGYLSSLQQILCGPEGLLFAHLPVKTARVPSSQLPAQPVSTVAEIARRDALKKVILSENLPAHNWQLLFDRFGLRDGVVRTEAELAVIYGLTNANAGTILESSYRLLRDHADLQPFMFTQTASEGPTCMFDQERDLRWNNSVTYS